MFSKDDEGKTRFLDVRLWDWPWLLVMSSFFLVEYSLVLFEDWSILQIEAFVLLWSVVAIPSIRMFYQMARSNGKDLDWDRLPEILPGMVRGKVFSQEQAIGIYDLFFYQVHPLEREWDLRTFAPLPPKKIINELER